MNHSLKRALALGAALVLALSLAACGGKTAPSASASASSPSSADPGLPVVEAPAASVAEPENEVAVEGAIVAASMNVITIRTAAGDELDFPTVDAEVVAPDGILEGDTAVVEYRGQVNGTDTSGAYVDRVTVTRSAAQGIEMAPCDETVYVTHQADLHGQNSNDSAVLGTLDKGTQLHRTGKGPHGWSRVEYNGLTGYLFGDYLSDQQPAQPLAQSTAPSDTMTAMDKTVYTTVQLRIRQAPGLDAAKIGSVAPGTALHQTGALSNGWARVDYNGAAGYCDAEYLTDKAPARAVDPDAAPAGEVNRAPANKTYYTTVALKLHKTYSTDASVLAVLPKGTPVYVENLMDNHWAEVSYQNTVAYCVTQYLSEQQPAAVPQATADSQNFTAVNDTVYPISELWLRQQPGVATFIVAIVPAGTGLQRTGISTDGQWSRISYNGQTVYGATQYISGEQAPSIGSGAGVGGGIGSGAAPAGVTVTDVNETMYITADNLNLHTYDDMQAPVVTVAPAGTQVTRTGILDNGWSRIYWNGEVLYCSSAYLRY